MIVYLNNSSISSLENVATEITSAWKYTNFVDGIKRGCSGTRSTKMRSERDTALQIATRSNRTGDDEEVHQHGLCRSRHSDRHGEEGISNETLKNLKRHAQLRAQAVPSPDADLVLTAKSCMRRCARQGLGASRKSKRNHWPSCRQYISRTTRDRSARPH